MKKMCLLIIGLAFIFAFSYTSCEIHSEEKNPAIENTDSSNTQNPDSGNTDKPDSGNTDKPDSGNTDKPDSGNTDNPDSGNTDNPNSGNTDNPDSGNTDNPDSGNTDKPDSGNTDNPDSGNTDNPNSGNTENPDSGNTDNPDSGNTDKPDSGNTDNPDSGNTDNPNSGNTDEPVTPNPSWVYNDLNIQKFHKLGITGKGIKIAVGDGNSNKVPTDGKMNIVGANVNGTGTNDHIYGTISVMASKEFGIAPEADYYFLNFDPKDGDLIGLSQAIRWCADNVDLMVLACGWKKDSFFSSAYADEKTQSMVRAALDYAHEKNLIMIISEGNSAGTNLLEYPQELVHDFIRVGGCNKDFTYNTNCTISWFRDVLAYYENVYKYDSKYNIVDNQTGTSFGVPIVGGIVALLLQQVPDFTQDEIREYLHQTAFKPEGMDLNYDKYYGYGIAMPTIVETYKKQAEIDAEKSQIVPLSSVKILNENVSWNESTKQYEVVLQKGESITLDCEYYPQNHTDFLRLPIGNKNLLNEIDKTLTITAKQVAGSNVINGANCNNEVVVLIKVTVE